MSRYSEEQEITPGAGAYSVERGLRSVSRNAPAYTIKGAHESFVDTATSQQAYNPGPAYFTPRRSAGPGVSYMGTRRREPLTPKSPGPGKYSIASPFEHSSKSHRAPAFSLSARTGRTFPDPGPQDNPGLAHCGLYGDLRGFMATFARAERPSIETGDPNNPGPGAYNADASFAAFHQTPAKSLSSRWLCGRSLSASARRE